METFNDFVYLADTPDDYINLIRKALDENNDILKTGRINFALTHTWEQSVKLMIDQINKIQAA